MKKIFTFAAVAAVVLSSCAKIETVKVVSENEAINFGVYVPNSLTKAGSDNVLTNTELQSTGFGVFAAYSPNGTYNSSSSKMDFMWNQPVEYSASAWSYSPVKYWPNQTGTDAVSTPAVDVLSFFAYAPFVDPANNGTFSPAETGGITGITANTEPGDPKVSYVCDPAHPVDLCWGVVETDGNWATAANDSPNTVTAGKPYLNLVKPKGTPKVKFLFKHALAKLVVDVKTLEAGAGTSNIGVDNGGKADGSRIFIKSLTINGTDIYNSGTLNLNNTTVNTPLWEVANDATAGTEFVVDITSNTKLYNNTDPTTVTWDEDGWVSATKPGVTSTAVELYSGMAIPTVVKNSVSSSAALTSVNIVYDVITKDDRLEKGLSVIENNITKTISAAGFDALQAGYVYTLHLQLGMKTVDVDADITGWDESTNETDVDLPLNN